MTQRPLVNLLTWQVCSWRFSGHRTTLQFAPLSFDVSFQEIFSALTSGGRLVMVSDEIRRNPATLLQLISEAGVERLFLPFVALQHVAAAAEGWALDCSCLCEVIVAGEQLQITKEIASWFASFDGCILHNQYGPTEAHVVTAFPLAGPPAEWPTFPPIGRPIANTQVYLLDRHLHPVPIGVVGELYLGGAGLARGYLHRPELTPERFIPHPFSELPGERLYRTGDLARYRPDGNIEFLGRLDHQVKVRGFRIELGEIEAVLGGHPGVREVVVLAREDSPGEKRLVAYVVAQEGPAPSGSELRGFLKERLPEYMVPSTFVGLEALPLTPNGKVDRRALPVPEGRGVAEGYVPPCTPTEELLAGIWGEVLHLERVGRQDNFFALGGHSLVAIRVVSRVRDTFGVELPVRCVFESPTVAELECGRGGGPRGAAPADAAN